MTDPVRQIRPAPVQSIVEGQLLGALLELGREARELLEVSGLAPDDLRDVRVRCGWRVVGHLVERSQVVSLETVFSAGKSRNLFCEADGGWLASLAAANVLTRETFGQLAADLRRGVLAKAIAEALEPKLRDLRLGNFSTPVVIAEFEKAIDALVRSDVRGDTAASDVLELAENWERRERTNSTPNVLSRIRLLDEATAAPMGLGGFPPKFCVIMGQPGVGKNMLLAGMIRAQLEADAALHIGAFFLEDGSRWLLKRWAAVDLGLPLSAIGVAQRSQEHRDKLAALEPHYFKLLERVHCYRYRRIRAAEMIHVSRVWVHKFGVGEILFDNLTHLDHRPAPFEQNGFRRQWVADKRHEQVAEAVESFAEFADRREIPVVALAHTVRPESEKHDCRPPRLSEVADSSGIERVARFAAGLWRTRSMELRLTIQKNTEGPGSSPPVTIELERITEAATINPFGGRVVNLDQEAREERANQASQKADEAFQRYQENQKRKAAAKAAEKSAAPPAAPTPAPQLDLLGAVKP